MDNFLVFIDCTDDGDEFAGILTDRETFRAVTWSPDCFVKSLFPFRITGATYADKKADAQRVAQEWQTIEAGASLSYVELIAVNSFFEKVATRYGLRREFRENCII